MRKLDQLLKICVCLGGLAVYGLALYVPIYTDEIVTRMVHSRYYLDGHTLKYLFPQCVSTFFSPCPLLLLPSFTLDAWTHADVSNLGSIRIFGCLSALMWMLFIAVSIGFLEKKIGRKSNVMSIGAFVVAACTLGITPFVMVLNRPEQFMVIIISLLGLMPLLINPPARKVSEIFLSFILVSVALIFFPSHPKTLLFLPLWIVVVWFLVQSKAMRVVVLTFVIAISAQIYFFYSSRSQCPEDPALEAKLQHEMVSPSSIIKDPVNQISFAFNNLIDIDAYVKQIYFLPAYQVGWLPQGESFFKIDIVSLFLNFFSLIWVHALLLFSTFATFGSLWRDIHNRVYRVGTGIQTSLWLSIIALLACESSKFFYETRLFIPLVELSAIIAWYEYFWSKLKIANLKIAFYALLVAALLSQIELVRTFKDAPKLWSSPSMQDQKILLTVPSISYSPLRESIQRTAQKCHMVPTEKMNRLVIDDWTYPVMSLSFQPFHVVFLKYVYWQSVTDLKDFIKKKDSDGFILRCDWIEDKSAYENLIEENGICCWNARQ